MRAVLLEIKEFDFDCSKLSDFDKNLVHFY